MILGPDNSLLRIWRWHYHNGAIVVYLRVLDQAKIPTIRSIRYAES